MRLFAWSDLHVDYPANFRLLEQVSRHDLRQDALMIAGDVSSDPEKVARALGLLKERFNEVAFVPGNHDLWVSSQGHVDSLEKLHQLRAVCRTLEVRVEPFDAWVGEQTVRIVPLLSWYLKPEEGVGSLFVPKPREDPELRMWADNRRVRWPESLGRESPAAHLLSLNADTSMDGIGRTITFSHFLPRRELVFGDGEKVKRANHPSGADPNPEFNFTRVAGCEQLDEQLRKLGSRVHIYGHQHRNRDRSIAGVRYVSHCLGYPQEWTGGRASSPRGQPFEIKLNG